MNARKENSIVRLPLAYLCHFLDYSFLFLFSYFVVKFCYDVYAVGINLALGLLNIALFSVILILSSVLRSFRVPTAIFLIYSLYHNVIDPIYFSNVPPVQFYEWVTWNVFFPFSNLMHLNYWKLITSLGLIVACVLYFANRLAGDFEYQTVGITDDGVPIEQKVQVGLNKPFFNDVVFVVGGLLLIIILVEVLAVVLFPILLFALMIISFGVAGAVLERVGLDNNDFKRFLLPISIITPFIMIGVVLASHFSSSPKEMSLQSYVYSQRLLGDSVAIIKNSSFEESDPNATARYWQGKNISAWRYPGKIFSKTLWPRRDTTLIALRVNGSIIQQSSGVAFDNESKYLMSGYAGAEGGDNEVSFSISLFSGDDRIFEDDIIPNNTGRFGKFCKEFLPNKEAHGVSNGVLTLRVYSKNTSKIFIDKIQLYQLPNTFDTSTCLDQAGLFGLK